MTCASAATAAGFDPDGAELELGDLPEGVDLVDGEQVGGRLAEVERDEAAARGLAVRHARLELDRAPSRGDPGKLAVGDAEPLGVDRD